jgi:hypothetical protein
MSGCGVIGSLSKEGRENAARNKSSFIAALLNEKSDNYRSNLEKRGIKPKNYHKQNLKHIQSIQQTKKLHSQLQKEKQIRAQLHIKRAKDLQFKNIASKVKIPLKNNADAGNENGNMSKKVSFIQKNIHSLSCDSNVDNNNNNNNDNCDIYTNSRSASLSAASEKPRISRKCSVPKHNEISSLKKRANKDFLQLNMQLKKMAVADVSEKQWIHKKNYGKVPEYLLRRKQENLEIEQKKMEDEEAAKIPPGMRQMTQNERLETLQLLNANKDQILNRIKLLPLVIETPSMIKYSADLRHKLHEIEDAIKIFSKTIVFVLETEQ